MTEEKFNSDLNRTGELSEHVKFFESKETFKLSSGEKLNDAKPLACAVKIAAHDAPTGFPSDSLTLHNRIIGNFPS